MNSPTAEYLLLFRVNEDSSSLSPEEIQTMIGKFLAWHARLTEEGKVIEARPLARPAKIVSGKGGRVVADGPFAESKEAINGFFLISANSMDEAVAIAQGCPGLEGGMKVEVRPVGERCQGQAQAKELHAEYSA